MEIKSFKFISIGIIILIISVGVVIYNSFFTGRIDQQLFFNEPNWDLPMEKAIDEEGFLKKEGKSNDYYILIKEFGMFQRDGNYEYLYNKTTKKLEQLRLKIKFKRVNLLDKAFADMVHELEEKYGTSDVRVVSRDDSSKIKNLGWKLDNHTLIVENHPEEKYIRIIFDRTPPEAPVIIGVEENKTYILESVTIQVDNIDAYTSYEASIDGKPYVLGTEYKVEGKHEIKVVARKNGMTKETKVPFEIDLTTYSKKEVEYFTEIALGSEFGGASKVVRKWTEDVKIKLHGNPSKESLETLNQVVEDLNEIIETIEISVLDKDTEEEGNIDMYFIPHEDYKDYTYNKTLQRQVAFFQYYSNHEKAIYGARIFLPTTRFNQMNRNHLIREELTQALGMGNDSWLYDDSVFYQGRNFPDKYTEYDEKVIEILYREDIELGMNQDEVMEVLRGRIVGN
ncbi:DUF2927 domain-containing protein [Alkaliphilus hydrothermalis]|uniref:Uncharacterized protein n=1 Tax=Alkaliphilus hydrothermalis TaxID=1482730 RepID=A0ABS2NLZ5_9FIRM|nr:DUF2927 domain-containing protein [Alkaliphilus hydrothermalis]MBM7613945.1 hypothetical protein [Alkaliphilus hydrothermalis]